jgi:hypothetical protein
MIFEISVGYYSNWNIVISCSYPEDLTNYIKCNALESNVSIVRGKW